MNTTELNNLRSIEVENIDDEIYYREIQGCQVNRENTECAVVSCHYENVRVCQKPLDSEALSIEENVDGYEC